MNIEQFISDYRDFLQTNFNPERAEKEKAYLYSDLKHYGLSVGERRKYVKTYEKSIKGLTKREVLGLVKKFWNMPSHEEKSMAFKILKLHVAKLTLGDMSLIEKMMRESKGWAFLDNLIIPIMPEIINNNVEAYRYLKKWIRDKDFWVRRSALLAQLLFFRAGEGGDRKLFFDMAKSQFNESWINEAYKDKTDNKRAKFFIRKAIGWALREMSAKNPKVVFNFLKANKSKMSGLSFREGSRKLPRDLQARLAGV
ncbi:DNA alkylation repair protein [Patescibacteria group bacterium]|nr:DNA alkylation repair protein [Patescibacteria group bacterium]MBU1868390.1 DNA alkylation repair protein [Patescibacteria group bacterium]